MLHTCFFSNQQDKLLEIVVGLWTGMKMYNDRGQTWLHSKCISKAFSTYEGFYAWDALDVELCVRCFSCWVTIASCFLLSCSFLIWYIFISRPLMSVALLEYLAIVMLNARKWRRLSHCSGKRAVRQSAAYNVSICRVSRQVQQDKYADGLRCWPAAEHRVRKWRRLLNCFCTELARLSGAHDCRCTGGVCDCFRICLLAFGEVYLCFRSWWRVCVQPSV